MTFNTLGLSKPILDAIAEKGYTEPSPIQAAAIPAVLSGSDVMAAAQTGTGKTAGFTLPILEKLSAGKGAGSNQVRALILTPTRELAAQIAENVETYGKNLALRSTVVFGGVKINPQMMRLRRGADILVATPGRLLDLYQQRAIKFDQLEVLVLDEADRMLDMGFIHDIRKIIAILPKQRQNLLFSATFSDDIRELAKSIVNDPVQVSVAPPNATADKVTQKIYPVDKKRKAELLIHLVGTNNWKQVLVFTRTKHGANKLTKQLDISGIPSAAIHGNKSQGARTKALADFKRGKVQVLVATDIAARGIDINLLPHVVNFDLPNVSEDYVHRIGRTARAGNNGAAVSLVSADEVEHLSNIERLIKKLLPREEIEGFEPEHGVPETKLNTRPFKAKKAKVTADQNRSSGNGRRSSKQAQPRQGRARQDQNRGPRDGQKSGRGRPANAAQGQNRGGDPDRARSAKPPRGDAQPDSNENRSAREIVRPSGNTGRRPSHFNSGSRSAQADNRNSRNGDGHRSNPRRSNDTRGKTNWPSGNPTGLRHHNGGRVSSRPLLDEESSFNR